MQNIPSGAAAPLSCLQTQTTGLVWSIHCRDCSGTLTLRPASDSAPRAAVADYKILQGAYVSPIFPCPTPLPRILCLHSLYIEMPPPTLYSAVFNTTVEHVLSPLDALGLYVLDNSTRQALACGSDFVFNTCPGICPNPDIMGIGVRVAFYIQSGLNGKHLGSTRCTSSNLVFVALLVVFSPTDSVATTWSGTLLTTALIIAAFVLKAKNSLTLYHATLVLK